MELAAENMVQEVLTSGVALTLEIQKLPLEKKLVLLKKQAT